MRIPCPITRAFIDHVLPWIRSHETAQAAVYAIRRKRLLNRIVNARESLMMTPQQAANKGMELFSDWAEDERRRREREEGLPPRRIHPNVEAAETGVAHKGSRSRPPEPFCPELARAQSLKI
ncbi:MAG: hypothetical protein F4Z28_18070 [Gammaproteobacteria bacterium]|nr:hypothetical protein [Gammaproteobacteria bacterium]